MKELTAKQGKVYRIPISKLSDSLDEFLFSALNFWQAANYVAEKGGLKIAVGLSILAIEELGKYNLLHEAALAADPKGELEIREAVFKSHRIKSEKGQELLKGLGVDVELAGIPLTKETREQLWYVAWDDKSQQFKRDLGPLERGAMLKEANLRELIRQGLNMMRELFRNNRSHS